MGTVLWPTQRLCHSGRACTLRSIECGCRSPVSDRRTRQQQLDAGNSVFLAVADLHGPFSRDLFAARHNHQLPACVSWLPDPDAEAVDALSLMPGLWENAYLFPPFAVIGQFLQFIQTQHQTSNSESIPLFNTKIHQMLPQDFVATKSIASVRIHVERAIKRVKEFHLLAVTVNNNVFDLLQQMVFAVCMLCNFQPTSVARWVPVFTFVKELLFYFSAWHSHSTHCLIMGLICRPPTLLLLQKVLLRYLKMFMDAPHLHHTWR